MTRRETNLTDSARAALLFPFCDSNFISAWRRERRSRRGTRTMASAEPTPKLQRRHASGGAARFAFFDVFLTRPWAPSHQVTWPSHLVTWPVLVIVLPEVVVVMVVVVAVIVVVVVVGVVVIISEAEDEDEGRKRGETNPLRLLRRPSLY